MSEPDEIKDAVVTSLREQPSWNTPTLIAEHADDLPKGTGPDTVERALRELVDEGRVKKRPTGWKLAPGT